MVYCVFALEVEGEGVAEAHVDAPGAELLVAHESDGVAVLREGVVGPALVEVDVLLHDVVWLDGVDGYRVGGRESAVRLVVDDFSAVEWETVLAGVFAAVAELVVEFHGLLRVRDIDSEEYAAHLVRCSAFGNNSHESVAEFVREFVIGWCCRDETCFAKCEVNGSNVLT